MGQSGSTQLSAAQFTKLQEAITCHQQNKLDEAEVLYQALIAEVPNHAESHYLLGSLYMQRRDLGQAVEFLGKSVEMQPENPDFLNNYGAALKANGFLEKALAQYEKAVGLNPYQPVTLENLGDLYESQEQYEKAKDCYEQAQRLAPENAELKRKIGEIYVREARYEDSLPLLKAYFEHNPDHADCANIIAYAYGRLGQQQDSLEWHRIAAETDPDRADLLGNYVEALQVLGRIDEAKEALEKALAVDPLSVENQMRKIVLALVDGREEDVTAMSKDMLKQHHDHEENLFAIGNSLAKIRRGALSIPFFSRVLEINPHSYKAAYTLGNVLFDLEETDAAIEWVKRSYQLNPNSIEALVTICYFLGYRNRWQEAYLYSKLALDHEKCTPSWRINPGRILHTLWDYEGLEAMGSRWDWFKSQYWATPVPPSITELAYAENAEDNGELYNLLRRWADAQVEVARQYKFPERKTKKKKGDRLKIGFLSSDLQNHVVARFVMQIMLGHDSEKFSFNCLSTSPPADSDAQRMMIEAVDKFIFVHDKTAFDIAKAIQTLEIDILFDLNGHTKGAQLPIMAYRPAPIQVEWLGFPYSTGMAEVDYFLLDPYYAPTARETMAEEPLLMPKTCINFTPEAFAPVTIINCIPADQRDYFTFGTMNNTYKGTKYSLDLWARVLREVPNSKFLIVREHCRSPLFQSFAMKEFEKRGVDPTRILFFANEPKRHWHCYNDIDVSLDTYPISGGTTTCDSLWMGVPVVSRVGPYMHQRISYTILENAGLGELCSFSDDEYVECAKRLAADHDKLRYWRKNLRNMLKESPLCDAKAFTRDFENLMMETAIKHGLYED